MGTALGVLMWLVILAVVCQWRAAARKRKSTGRTAPPARRVPTAQRPAARPAPAPPGGVIGGWLLGHEVAHNHSGFPGDPLPHGHLGSPANLAFWGGMYDDEDDEDFD